jgi:hypothetical protein
MSWLEALSEIGDLSGIPLWQLLARPAISHVRVQMGEVDALVGAVRHDRMASWSICEPPGIRTRNQGIKSPLLYR